MEVHYIHIHVIFHFDIDSKSFHLSSRRSLVVSVPQTGSLSGIQVSVPIIPEFRLPCIPIAPPALMFCPEVRLATNIGLGIEPEIEESIIGLAVKPSYLYELIFLCFMHNFNLV